MTHLSRPLFALSLLTLVASAHAESPFARFAGRYKVVESNCVDERAGNAPIAAPVEIVVSADTVVEIYAEGHVRYPRGTVVTIQLKERDDRDDGYGAVSTLSEKDGKAVLRSSNWGGSSATDYTLEIGRRDDGRLVYETYDRADVAYFPHWNRCRLIME